MKYLLSAIYNNVCTALHNNKKKFLASPKYNKYKSHLEPAPGIVVPDKHKLFALSKVMHGVWATSKEFFITKTMKSKLTILHKLAMGKYIHLGIPNPT